MLALAGVDGSGDRGCRAPRVACGALLASLFLLSPADADSSTNQGKPPSPPPTVFGGLPLPKPGYAEALARANVQSTDHGGLEVRIAVLPDLYRFEMARGLERLAKAGYRGDRLEREIRNLHKKVKRLQGRCAFRFSLEGGGARTHHFLSKPPKKHLKVSGGASGVQVKEVSPPPRFFSWTIIQGPSLKKMKLARYQRLAFTCISKRKSGKKAIDPIVVQLRDLLRYREIEKKSEYETKGINVDAKQISLGNFRDMLQDPISFTVYPGKVKVPKAPDGFESILKHLARR